MGSPFYGDLGGRLAELADSPDPFLDLFTPWADASLEDLSYAAVPLRFLGALHDLVLEGRTPELQGVYPGDAAAVIRALPAILERRGADIRAFMTTPPQTNEVNRSAALLPGFLSIAKETGLPLRTLELGASAGLNLNWDRFAYDYGDTGRWGDPGSAVKLGSIWSGGPPPLTAPVRVVERSGVDKDPVDVRDLRAARRLQAYVWPDQPVRLERLRAAIAVAQASNVAIEKGDAADWIDTYLGISEGVATVVYHSVFWQYLPAETQVRIRAAIRRVAEQATHKAPLAWLRMEPEASLARCELRLDLWPQAESRLLGTAQPHGADVEWLDG